MSNLHEMVFYHEESNEIFIGAFMAHYVVLVNPMQEPKLFPRDYVIVNGFEFLGLL